jgi:hypothetical protein
MHIVGTTMKYCQHSKAIIAGYTKDSLVPNWDSAAQQNVNTGYRDFATVPRAGVRLSTTKSSTAPSNQ